MKMSKNCSDCPASWVCAEHREYGDVECKHFHIDAEIVFTSTNTARDETVRTCHSCGRKGNACFVHCSNYDKWIPRTASPVA